MYLNRFFIFKCIISYFFFKEASSFSFPVNGCHADKMNLQEPLEHERHEKASDDVFCAAKFIVFSISDAAASKHPKLNGRHPVC